ncbi:putative surface protein with fasciclin (FAS1) repeats [Salinibacter ruber]|nr:putative surface protein with fasciclin (FAS1) repeats [Salinibacter ruber]
MPDTVDYYMQGYTVNKDYTWTVNGSSDFPVAASSDQTYEWQSRGGEFITVVYGPGDPIATTSGMSASTNSIKVNASNDNINAETIDVSAAVTDNLSGQIGRFGAFSTLTSLAASSGIADVLSQEGPSFTLFAPSEAAFAALENVPTQATDGDEDATTSVRADILKYHAIQGDSLTASDLPANGVETLLGSETVSVTAEMVSQANIPATNGVIHKLDGAPLLPPTASVDFTDRTVADTTVTQDAPDDSLTVDGSYFPEEGGYILLYDDSGSVVGESKYISGPGVSNEVKVGLEENFSSGTGPITLVAIPHRENSGNESFDGDSSDPPYQLDGSDVTDEAVIDVESTD